MHKRQGEWQKTTSPFQTLWSFRQLDVRTKPKHATFTSQYLRARITCACLKCLVMPNIPRVGVSANSLNMQEYTYKNTMVLRTDDSPSLQHWLCSAAGMALFGRYGCSRRLRQFKVAVSCSNFELLQPQPLLNKWQPNTLIFFWLITKEQFVIFTNIYWYLHANIEESMQYFQTIGPMTKHTEWNIPMEQLSSETYQYFVVFMRRFTFRRFTFLL